MFPVKKDAQTFGLNLLSWKNSQGKKIYIMGFLYEIVRCVLLAVVMEPCL